MRVVKPTWVDVICWNSQGKCKTTNRDRDNVSVDVAVVELCIPISQLISVRARPQFTVRFPELSSVVKEESIIMCFNNKEKFSVAKFKVTGS